MRFRSTGQPAMSPLPRAMRQRGKVVYLTEHGERLAAIVPAVGANRANGLPRWANGD